MQKFDEEVFYGAGVLTRNRETVRVFVFVRGEQVSCELTAKFGDKATIRNVAGRTAEVSIGSLLIEEAEAARCLEAGQKKAQAIEEVTRLARMNAARRNQSGQFRPFAGR